MCGRNYEVFHPTSDTRQYLWIDSDVPALLMRVIKVEHVKETGEFLIEIMPLMFIPAGVGLVTSWNQLQSFLVPLLVITVVSTFVVMIVTGKVTDFLISKRGEKK